ncbi:winged helix-turn-helix transcriptional regulator [Leekyejoonella antrihumi]|uniref:Helix-turn-helix transcriptional regulator n=1 Tax=Leekyejoonella antrihumi TaxID=1660198 RepID=A0A563E5Y8_9MICO|nr:helix-turn-helix domain-containing protein [Leekyejoonella antrihumi]TWP37709.1 helix-turn-helix transcriptional regulator [Leekyejoonella antrihumi]
MAKIRRYDDPCGVARALAVIGERWAVLIVRELLLGPKRFGAIRAGLHGISPNVLSQRLHELEGDGIVRRGILPPPADVAIYELTDRGRALEPVLVELGRWGSREPNDTEADLGVDALMLALKTLFDTDCGLEITLGITVDRQNFRLTVIDQAIDIQRDEGSVGPTHLTTDAHTLRAVAFGRETVSHAQSQGRLIITGDDDAAHEFPRIFCVPT